MRWSCDECGVSLDVPDGHRVRCAHSAGVIADAAPKVTQICLHHSRLPVAKMECGCGSAHRCNLSGKLCSYSKPIDEFVFAGDVQLTSENFQHCSACSDQLIPAVITIDGHDCIQSGPAVDVRPGEPVRCDVVIPFCSVDSHYLIEAVESVLAQQHAEPLIHIVADGCAFPAELLDDPRIRRYSTRGNCGPYRITNALFPFFESDYIALLDADDIADPDRLWKQIATLDRYGCDVISGAMQQFVAGDCSADPELQQRLVNHPRLHSGLCWATTPRGAMINSVRTMTRSLFERLNGFAPWPMASDNEFDNRCAYSADVRIFHATDVFGRRRLHSASLTNGVFQIGSAGRAIYTELMIERLRMLSGGAAAQTLGGELGERILI